MNIDATTSQLAAHGVAFAPAIARAAARHNVDPTLLAAVAAQETGGPGSNAGRNIVGDGGHGRGLFQIDDRWHDFAKAPAAMDPGANADYAAGMLHGLIAQFGGNVHKALSAYNSGSPNATGTTTTWGDGQTLGYADSVMKHYQQIGGSTGGLGTAPSEPGAPGDPALLEESVIAELSTLMAAVGSLASQAQSMPGMPSLSQPQQTQSYHRATTDYSGLFGDDES
jgi:Transglycosylase SLT domain